MNFQNLGKIEPPSVYLDQAFRAARTKEKKDNIHMEKVQAATQVLTKCLGRITEKFPKLDELPEFYLELVRASLDYVQLKKSLGAVKWAEKRIGSLGNHYSARIAKNRSETSREFYGRVSSVLKQIKEELAYLDHARVVMKRFPAVKTGRFTVAITGYPNVGKSSLLNALTTAKAEVKSYAFTTKDLNIGYMDKVQLIDTPGTFDRDKMNNIEVQAYLVVKLVADLIVHVIDPTESCGYSLSKQNNLLARIKKIGKPVMVVYSKCDIQKHEGLCLSSKTGEGVSSLKKLIKHHESKGKGKNNKD